MSGLNTLWIMRHGLAASEFESDFNRALSPVGEKQAEDIGQQFLANGENLPERMLVSPFRRTQETATIIHKKIGLEQAFETEEMLVHFADHQVLGDYLLTLEETNVMIVSHMPIVARLTQYLVPGCDIFGFQTAQLVRIDFDSTGESRVARVYLPKD
ncbi:phosphohistidine phosphatase SixA [Aliikangiella sp. G2MR2-5]|uniref:phosphohistidine phosphatase SixA n=1 Tax=Aliikangiella sp. G2MR2-5 TaxID=2788943 RepID=UPI0018A96F2A|nr:phosphohistidine phosphatase SixA [Aliikangiella sp. G2MR2-5]